MEQPLNYNFPLLNLPFAGDTATWALMTHAGGATFEAHGPYQRRTARTRTTILSQSGPLDISVPIRTAHNLMYRDTRINYDTDWDRQLMYALRTAYNSTPFFEYFEQDFHSVTCSHHEFLWDLNMEILNLIASSAGLHLTFSETPSFAPPQEGQVDLRIAIETKFAHKAHDLCQAVPYTQIFGQPYTNRPFTPWLSMLDLLFNMGPECRLVLNSMISK